MTGDNEADEALGRRVAAHDGARVRFSCAACGASHDVSAAHVIWLLKALDLGDEQTSVADCARLDDHACVRCGGRRWTSGPCPRDHSG